MEMPMRSFVALAVFAVAAACAHAQDPDRKSTRLNSSHQIISYAVFCLKKKNDNFVNTVLEIVSPLLSASNTAQHLLFRTVTKSAALLNKQSALSQRSLAKVSPVEKSRG